MSFRSFIPTILQIVGCLFLGGCTYHAGYPIDQYGIKTIYVKPAVKEAVAAQLSGTLTAQIREEILRKGFIRITDQKETADAILETTITDYNRGISITEKEDDDDEKVKSLYFSATVKYKLTDNHTDQTISDGSVSANVSIYATTLAQAIEYQRTPQLTRSIAKQIAQAIVLKEKPKEKQIAKKQQTPSCIWMQTYDVFMGNQSFEHPQWGRWIPIYLVPLPNQVFFLRSIPSQQQPLFIIPQNSFPEKSFTPIQEPEHLIIQE